MVVAMVMLSREDLCRFSPLCLALFGVCVGGG